MRSRPRSRFKGFTLLELLLTLALAVVLMTLVNSAFSFYVSTMDSSDAEMRRTMLASAVMQMIEDDLRSSMHPEPLDTSALEELLSATAKAAGGSSGGGSGGQTGGDAEAAGTADPDAAGEDDMTSTDTTLLAGTVVLQTPGLVGNQYQIQVDTSRLPRLEEYGVMMAAEPGQLVDIPSDLKTVTYYVQDADAIGVDDALAKLDGSTDGGSGGLVRRVLDRNVTSFAMTQGSISALTQSGDLLAPEVVGIEFSYWDGMTWQIEWNSDEMGELPLAVKIQLTMIDPLIDANDQTPRMFSHIVQLPMAKFIVEEEEDELSGAGI
ncbi:prepilin-type N-terminal cleavage/methylation domain-containing protein [Roseiconus lacunae]|uniref:Prepilin-type N-terminal cleavage/methylation domain-containing protein n=1 Tax=Roseiconus lacunae TaxID=2605694 RepID=A0ABT7PPT0_9BACT|nr:prepilin-type N-terminal cleavage/methylation domain-containing protein [Roseiconus lacunae]MCD0458911.1 type II secretion system protein GspJ [Roseiconus lacunae]MDM4018353.1 prepilin-type N-terminal cleavage/methylation domain-containing protein [Roseiconus lacunae]